VRREKAALSSECKSLCVPKTSSSVRRSDNLVPSALWFVDHGAWQTTGHMVRSNNASDRKSAPGITLQIVNISADLAQALDSSRSISR
jgi:hypothetical protein